MEERKKDGGKKKEDSWKEEKRWREGRTAKVFYNIYTVCKLYKLVKLNVKLNKLILQPLMSKCIKLSLLTYSQV